MRWASRVFEGGIFGLLCSHRRPSTADVPSLKEGPSNHYFKAFYDTFFGGHGSISNGVSTKYGLVIAANPYVLALDESRVVLFRELLIPTRVNCV